MSALYPLRFRPLLRRYLWGGRRLGIVLGKRTGPGEDYAESWEIVDRGADQSQVRYGPLKGVTLHDLVVEHGEALMGKDASEPRFPLLFKYLDANRPLSVQVHPNDQQAARLDPPDLGKTEAWFVLQADPESRIYAGLKRGVDRAALQQAIAGGGCEEVLHWFHPRAGQCVFLPAGVVHALGKGLLIAEIQQASDTTYRLFDWNRVDADGKPRPLHIDEALEVIDFDYGPVHPIDPEPTGRKSVTRLVSCDKFLMDHWRINTAQSLRCDQRCHIVSVLRGTVRVAGDRSRQPLTKGDTVLLPASLEQVEVTPETDAELLDMYRP